jgi:DNA (cytosine-5)-methyltransferase 1
VFRLQGFPDSFKLPKSDTQAYKQFGNSVAVPVIKALAKQILKAMEGIPNAETKHKKINLEKIKAESISKALESLT